MFPPSTKILIVDDMGTMRAIIKDALTGLELKNFKEAPDGKSAWDLLGAAVREKKPFDLIISDWEMPLISGLDLLKKVRESAEMRDMAFLMCTGANDINQIKEAISAGVSSYVTKPFSKSTIAEKLDQIWKKRPKPKAAVGA